MNKYKIAVLEDDDVLREVIVESLRFRDFEATGYDEAERLLAEVFDTPLGPQAMPDVVVVDLSLKQDKMQGLSLVAELADRDAPAEMVVMSGLMPGSEFVEAVRMGAGGWIAKPFGILDFVKAIEKVSEIGRKRRLYRLGEQHAPHGIDLTRIERPVFLSYSTKDKRLAAGLRRNLEAKDIPVWYAPTTLDIGDIWRRRIEQGIDQAKIFLALITDNYQTSAFCIGELMRFHRRIEIGANPKPIILPVLAGLSEEGKQGALLRSILETYQYIDLSISSRFVDALTVLLARIQNELSKWATEVSTMKTPPNGAVSESPDSRGVA